MKGIAREDGSESDATSTIVVVPAPPDGTRRHGGPEVKAAVLMSGIPGPFGADTTDGAPGLAWGVADRLGGPVLLWGYLPPPPSDDHVWVPGRAASD